MDISKMHVSNADKIAATMFVQQNTREDFLQYYKNHTQQETLDNFNISISILRLVRKIFDITEMPKRVVKKPRRHFKYYTNGKQDILVYENESVPDGFVPKHIIKTEETCKKISQSKSGKITHNAGKICYTNGINNIYLSEVEVIPDGYYIGSTGLKDKKIYHNSEGKMKYFSLNDTIPDSWMPGEIKNEAKSLNSRKSRDYNIKEFEIKNDCTSWAVLKRQYKNHWNNSPELLSNLHIIKYNGYRFIKNEDIEKIKSYNGNRNINSQNKVLKFEQDNNCTLVNHLVQIYGQLGIIKDIPKIKYLKYNFIDNKYIPDIEKYKNEAPTGFSHIEKEVVEYIKDIYNGEVLENCNNVIKNPDTGYFLELDIYAPKKHIAIEFNGIYWHQQSFGTPKNYHEKKAKLCAEKGIRLIQIYSDEWKYKQDKIKQLLNISFGAVKNIIYARNCVVKKISNKEAEPFSNKTHLQGHRNASVTYGLFYKDELVQLMSFSKTANARANDAEWEIIRGCPGSNNIVIGGVSKLFKHFVQDYSPSSVFSYCDFNKFDGKSYEALGMKFIGYTGPDMNWIIDGKMVARSPKKHKELKEMAEGVIYGAGSKKYLWKGEDNNQYENCSN